MFKTTFWKSIFLLFFQTIKIFSADKITFSEHISPIIYKHCAICHKKNGIGPFLLTSYESVIKRGNSIKLATGIGYMPPFYADTKYSHLSDVNQLTENEILLIKNWVDSGMPRGKNPSPIFEDKLKVDKPDLVINFSKMNLKGDSKERFFNIKATYELPKEKLVCKCEFEPGNPKLVHHANVFLYTFTQNTKHNVPPYFIESDIFDSNFKIEDYLKLKNADGTPAISSHATIVDFFPGMGSTSYPKGINKSFTMAAKVAFFANSVHYGATSKDQVDKSSLKIWFCKDKPKRKVFGHAFGSPTHKITPSFPILANKTATLSTWVDFKKDISLLSIQPHAHLLATKIKMYAVTPQNIMIPILKLNNWNFLWQRVYKLKNPLFIPAFSKIYLEGEFDNTSKNPLNPNFPPKNVKESILTNDEMLQGWIDFMGYEKGDEKIDLEQK